MSWYEWLWHVLYGLWKNHLCLYQTLSYYKNLFHSLEFCFLLILLQALLLKKFNCISQIGIVWICIWNWCIFLAGCFLCQPLIYIAFDCHIPQQNFQRVTFQQDTLFLPPSSYFCEKLICHKCMQAQARARAHTLTQACCFNVYRCCPCYKFF
jgi:hypothetical protein